MDIMLLLSTVVVILTLIIGILKILDDHKEIKYKLDALLNYLMRHEKDIELAIEDVSQLKK